LDRRLVLLLLVLVAVTLAASLALRGRGGPIEAAAPPETWGWWNVAARDADPVADDELARVLSLPYAAGTAHASGDRFGVRFHDPARAETGWNLYASGHAPEAHLIAMDGRLLHRWRVPFSDSFPDRAPNGESGFFRRVRLLSNGDLLALVQGFGLVRVDAGSRVIWRFEDALFNDLWVSPAADRIRVLAKAPRPRPDLRPGGPVLEDSLVELSGDGRELRRFSLLEALEASPFRALLQPPGPSADILHSNTIEVLAGAGAPGSGPFAPGRLLVSWREIDTVATLDPESGAVLWARRGPWDAQHEPSLEPDGALLVFDNQGGPGDTTRVLRVDPASGAILWQWAGPADRPLRSRQAGTVHRLPGGNLLVVESEGGRALELDPAGDLVWEFASPHRAGARRELVATLFDVERLVEPTPFLAGLDPPQAP